MYMLLPLMLAVFVWFYVTAGEQQRLKHRLYRGFVLGLCGLASVAPLALPFIPKLQFLLPQLWAQAALLSAGMAIVFVLLLKKKLNPVVALALVTFLARLGYGLTVLPGRAHEGNAHFHKQKALEVAKTINQAAVYRLDSSQIKFTTSFYLQAATGHILHNRLQPDSAAWYLVTKDRLPDQKHRVFMQWESEGRQTLLVRFSGE